MKDKRLLLDNELMYTLKDIKIKNMDRVEKPWGYYRVLYEGDGYKVKELVVKAGKRTSLQSHKHRDEYWIILKGWATVTNGFMYEDIVYEKPWEHKVGLKAPRSIHIKKGTAHRVYNPEQADLIIIEVQVGDYLEEDDIIRYADDYSRNNS